MNGRFILVATAALTWGAVSSSWAGNWTAWRGPDGTGAADEKGLPVTWSQKENVKWKKTLPGPGNSTPIVWGNHIFVSQALKFGAERTLMCFRRSDGEVLWTNSVSYTEKEQTHATNPYCSSSPVTDGQRVIVWHGSAGIYAYDFDGKPLWQKDLGKFDHVWGNASSPVLYKDSVILWAGPGKSTFLIALDKTTGEELWRNDTLVNVETLRGSGGGGSWSTPVLRDAGERTELILSIPGQLLALNPDSGEKLWWCQGLTKLVYTSPLVGPDYLVAMSGYGGAAIGVRPGQSGDVTETNQLWLHPRNPQRVGTGVIVGEYVYILHDTGVAWCLNGKTGEKKWEHRLSGTWSSMSHVDGKLYVNSTGGKTYVLEPNPEECKILAENSLGGTIRSSLAFSDGQIFVRTYEALYCIEEAQK